ncbi:MULTISPECIES: formylglycine-generating enzyme family protein [Halomonas]|uniref:formylglycine-generating enzyme family protein n=1 Tax=Halomonas TaxID=2745 RepID=UPI001C963CDB|nr:MULTISPECIES: SUMF1/EgtB/PvdO family nonheme iron enzyme [Halomonas]MBY6206510.1 formylglycine-generating enzyme family protein [Halomonas sp. DP3Y7-2]MBY6227599.1 formylglycine-generating enzyme family protein [Halomonas sp. DP3Y7-1]MCA0915664.1 formylglycine-generating enzyme family protein [Halomonas denitrificans]
MERFYRLSIPIIACVVMTGCDGSASQEEAGGHRDASSPVNQEAVAALIQKTMDNMVFVEGGSFQMGDFGPLMPNSGGRTYTADSDNKPVHEVTLDSFSISAVQVSYDDYDIYTEAMGLPRINTAGYEFQYRASNIPAGVDWYQARNYCEWLGDQTGLPFSLPTEAQWEYAARSRGQFQLYGTFDGKYMNPGVNYPTRDEIKSSTPSGSMGPHTIGLYPPNSIGLYQMGLNGFEWVKDWYDENFYKTSPRNNPVGPNEGEYKVLRGAGFSEMYRAKLIVNRRHSLPDLALDEPILSLTHSPAHLYTFRCSLAHDDQS